MSQDQRSRTLVVLHLGTDDSSLGMQIFPSSAKNPRSGIHFALLDLLHGKSTGILTPFPKCCFTKERMQSVTIVNVHRTESVDDLKTLLEKATGARFVHLIKPKNLETAFVHFETAKQARAFFWKYLNKVEMVSGRALGEGRGLCRLQREGQVQTRLILSCSCWPILCRHHPPLFSLLFFRPPRLCRYHCSRLFCRLLPRLPPPASAPQEDIRFPTLSSPSPAAASSSVPVPGSMSTTSAETGLSQRDLDILSIEADIDNAEAESLTIQARVRRLNASLKRRRMNPE